MTLLQDIFNTYKDIWFKRQIRGYKQESYYKFLKIKPHNTEIELIRYYPRKHKWQYDYIAKIEYLDNLTIIDDEELIIDLEAKYAKFLLTLKR